MFFGGTARVAAMHMRGSRRYRNSWEGVRRIRDCVLGCVVILCVII